MPRFRDPLLALGCQDPADRVSEAKECDNRRQVIAELFNLWWDRGRQFLSSQLQNLTGTRMAGFVMTRQTATGPLGS